MNKIIRFPIIARPQAFEARCIHNVPACLRRSSSGAARVAAMGRRQERARLFADLAKKAGELALLAADAAMAADSRVDAETFETLAVCYVEDVKFFRKIRDEISALPPGAETGAGADTLPLSAPAAGKLSRPFNHPDDADRSHSCGPAVPPNPCGAA